MKRINLKGAAVAGTSVLLAGGMSMSWAQAEGARQLEEIVVTAQKREQSLQDVPLAVTAVDARALAQRGIDNFDDYLRTVPGASFADQGSQGNEVKFRGIGNGTARLSPTTAIYLGEVPVIHNGRSINSSYNFHLVDIDRIEVLRGPQGQIYGSNSLGGAIKNVPTKPQLDELTMKGSLTASNTEDGGDNYEGDVTVNLPLADTFGARVTAYAREDSGWFDNVYAGGRPIATLIAGPPSPGAPGGTLPFLVAAHPEVAAYSAPSVADEDVNESSLVGTRVMLSWQPSDKFSADFMFAYEDKETDGASWAHEIPAVPAGVPGTFGVPRTDGQPSYPHFYTADAEDYEQTNPAVTGNSDEINLYNLVLNWDLDFAQFTSSTSYWDRTEELNTDIPLSYFVTGVVGAFPVVVERDDNPEAFIQEFRLTSADDQRLTWLAGLFYQDIEQDFQIHVEDLSGIEIMRKGFPLYLPPNSLFPGFPGGPPGPPRFPGQTVGEQNGDFTDEETAIFGEIAYDLTETLEAAFSFRYLEIDQTAELTFDGFFYASQVDTPLTENDEEEFLPKLTLSWSPDEDQLYYASASKGFRSGITNTAVPQSLCQQELAAAGSPGGLPATDPDTLWNYELGWKVSMMDKRVQVNGAIYYIDWSDLQSQVFLSSFGGQNSQCTFEGILNVGDASVRGFELEADALLTDNLRLNGSLSYTDPTYEDDYPQLQIESGDTIEGTAEWQSYIGLQYDFNLVERPAFVRVDWNYVGEIAARPGDFSGQPLEHDIGEYDQVNIRAGMDMSDNLALQLWVDNVFDEFGVTRAIDLTSTGTPTYFTIRPMTAGATLRFNF